MNGQKKYTNKFGVKKTKTSTNQQADLDKLEAQFMQKKADMYAQQLEQLKQANTWHKYTSVHDDIWDAAIQISPPSKSPGQVAYELRQTNAALHPTWIWAGAVTTTVWASVSPGLKQAWENYTQGDEWKWEKYCYDNNIFVTKQEWHTLSGNPLPIYPSFYANIATQRKPRKIRMINKGGEEREVV